MDRAGCIECEESMTIVYLSGVLERTLLALLPPLYYTSQPFLTCSLDRCGLVKQGL